MFQRKIFIAVLLGMFVSFLFIFAAYSAEQVVSNPNETREAIKDGVRKQVYKSGMREEAAYKNGKKHGPYKAYWKNGKLHAKINYKNGLPEGVVKKYYHDGRLFEESHYKDGKKDGILKRLDSKGTILQRDVYKDGLLLDTNGKPFDGAHKVNLEHGSWQEDNYKDGVLDGISNTFNKNGELVFERKFINGKVISTRSVSKRVPTPSK